MLAVINFWLFAQTLLNVIPGIAGELGIERTLGNLAVVPVCSFIAAYVRKNHDWGQYLEPSGTDPR